MGTHSCPDCYRPEGEMHKGGCRYDEGVNLVSWHDRDDELAAEYAASRATHPLVWPFRFPDNVLSPETMEQYR